MRYLLLFGLALSTGCQSNTLVNLGNTNNFVNSKSWQNQLYKVVRVSDGDTITVEMNGKNQAIRFACIDAPETRHGRTPAQPMGEQAKQNLQRLIEQGGGRVNIIDTGDRTYGRIVALVFTRIGNNQVFLQEEQTKSGLAWAYTRYRSNCSNWNIIENAESAAKQRRIGLWSLGNPEAPWDFRNRMRSQRGNRN